MSWRFIDILLHFPLLSLGVISLGIIIWLIGYRARRSRLLQRIGILIASIVIVLTAGVWIIEPNFLLTPADLQQSQLLKSTTYHPIKYSFDQSIYTQDAHTFLYELKPGYVHTENVYLVDRKTVASPKKRATNVDVVVYTPKSTNPLVRFWTTRVYQLYGTTLHHQDSAVVVQITKYRHIKE